MTNSQSVEQDGIVAGVRPLARFTQLWRPAPPSWSKCVQ